MIAQRLVHDAIHDAGGPLHIPITKSMLISCQHSCGRYKAALEAKRREENEFRNEEEDVKKKVYKEIKDLETKKRKLETETSAEALHLDIKIRKLRSKM